MLVRSTESSMRSGFVTCDKISAICDRGQFVTKMSRNAGVKVVGRTWAFSDT